MPRRGRGGGRRGRGENRPWMNRDGNRFRNRPEDDTWGNVRHVDRPRYLRGRAIGMYYHHMNKNQQTHKGQLLVTLRIPPAVEAQLNVNLGSITEIAKQLNIPISYPKLFEKPKKTADDFIPLFSKKQKPNEDHDIVDATKLRLEDDGIEWFPNKVEVIVVEDEEVKKECGIQSSASIKCDDKSHIKMSTEDVQNAGDVFTKPNSSPNCENKSQIKMSTEDIQDTENVFTKPNSSTKCDDKSQIKMSTEDVHDAGNVFKKPNFSTDCGDKSQIKMSTEDIKDGGEVFKKLESSNKCDEKSQIKMSTEDIQDAKNVFIEPKSIPVSRQISAADSEPSTSTATHYIPIESDNSCDDYEGIDCERIMPLRSGSDYKYSYEDIITGTFDEKLEECLNNGVNIAMSNRDIDEINKKLQAEYNSMVGRSGYQKMMKFRKTLPTFKKSQEILDVLNGTQVVVISGETGCGKSTQVPQIILDHALCNNNGANVKILVTQPRRIAASSLAERVANERGEKMGNSVGYAVRLERVEARSRGSILYCTTGILLADLEINQGLTNYSHIILDEVHERDTHVDLSMCMLKRVLQKRRDLKLILMSATIDAEKLSEYFDNCPMMHIEGLAFPVQDIYLEDILQLTKYKLPQEQKKVPEKRQKEMKYKKKKLLAEQMEKDIKYRAEIGEWLVSKKNTIDHEVYQTLLDRRIEDLNPKMISELMIHLCRGPPGAILVFLPGIGEITKLMRIMNDSQMFPHERYNIYPLHSKLPSLEQHQIFERPPNGIRKIIIATNIAETSITIDDIVYVIDCGKIKMRGLNVEEHVSTLKVEWAAVANLRQRRGRAGRCQPGICYHMVTSYRAGILPERLQPELQRSDLLEPVLTIKKLRLGRVAEALATVPAPPAETTVQRAVKHLQQCGALDDNETLTPLGWHLARLPVHPSAGKLLLLGALFGCLDRAASVAAVWGFKDPFQLVIGKEREVDTMKRKLALGEPSDHVAISEAIIQWEVSSYHQRRTFAYAHFLSYSTLQLLSDMKKQFGDTLKYMGFLASGNIKSQWENRNSNNLSLFKALVAASLYPNIAAVRWPNKNSKKYTTRQMSIKVRTTDEMRPIAIHPSSVMTVNHNNTGHAIPLCNKYGAGWLVYWLKQRSSDLFLLEVTLVYTLPLLFFGELNVTDTDIENDDECYMLISSVKVQCKKTTAKLLFQLRSMLDIVLASRIGSKEQTLQRRDFEELVLNSVIQLITAEDEQTDYLGDDEPSESDKSDNDNSETESLNYVLDRAGNNQPPMVPYTPRNQRYQNFSQFYN